LTVRLFTTIYRETKEQRRREYERCLQANVECKTISQICILDENYGEIPSHEKITSRLVSSRPTYQDFFKWINTTVLQDDFSIIANTDIALNDTIEIIRRFDWRTPKLCLALSRWDIDEQDGATLFEHGDSQDVWIFQGKIEGVNGNFPLGVYDCDNKIAWELEQAGYRVINPCYAVRTYHHHQSGYRSYEVGTRPDYGIRPPFRYVEPDNYWGPIRAWQIKRELDLNYLPWMMTQQRFWRYPLPKLALRIWNKLRRIVACAKTPDAND
jgi:hypothetical protein